MLMPQISHQIWSQKVATTTNSQQVQEMCMKECLRVLVGVITTPRPGKVSALKRVQIVLTTT